MDDPEGRYADHQADMLEIALTVFELRGRFRIPFEHRHAPPELADVLQLPLFGAVFSPDRIAAMINGSPLIPEAFHKEPGAVDAPGVVGAWAGVGPAQAGFRRGAKLIYVQHELP